MIEVDCDLCGRTLEACKCRYCDDTRKRLTRIATRLKHLPLPRPSVLLRLVDAGYTDDQIVEEVTRVML